MAKSRQRIVLFLGATEHDRSRQAEALFNSVVSRLGIPWQARSGVLVEAEVADLEGADRVVVVGEVDLRSALEGRFSGWADRVETWPVGPEPPEREVMELVARLLGGGGSGEPPPSAAPPPPAKPKARPVVRLGRETKGRKGKGVTVVWDLPLDEAGIEELAARLRQRCGTGGTVRDGRIEMQGDLRDRLVPELEALGYQVKRVGG